jgi:hypothetical protein
VVARGRVAPGLLGLRDCLCGCVGRFSRARVVASQLQEAAAVRIGVQAVKGESDAGDGRSNFARCCHS